MIILASFLPGAMPAQFVSLWLGHLLLNSWLVAAALLCSVGPALLFLANLRLYQPPPAASPGLSPVSVLIPARNEEASIAAALESVLASIDIEFEVIVLDDASTDRTAAIVGSYAARDPRVRLAHAPPLPAGWNGKQHACHMLAGQARFDVLCFLDADVRLDPNALARLSTFLHVSQAGLVSGFPLEETGSPLERLLIPLIHFVLLCFLPFSMLRKEPRNPAFAAGCGQVLMVKRAPYQTSGGHAAIRESMHDGLRLPRLFREHGYATDLADLTHLARCRMYTDAWGVWQGLTKNATEGMAAPARIVPFTLLLLAGQVLPLVLFLLWLMLGSGLWTGLGTGVALAASYLPRLVAAVRFRQSWQGALLHPLGITLLLILQWNALARKLLGYRATWKERACDVV